jgi:hypothetical protein
VFIRLLCDLSSMLFGSGERGILLEGLNPVP